MESMMAYGGNNLMNMIISKMYTAKRNTFKGSGTSSGLAYTFDVTEVPEAQMVANAANHNLAIDLKKVVLTVKGGILNFNQTLALKATGKMAISEGKLALTNLTVTAPSGKILDQLVVGVINTQVIPKLRNTLASMPIPQLTNVFGSGLSASLRSGKVIPGPALEAGARISGKTGIAAADAPAAATLASLNSGTAANALMIGLVSGGAVNAVMKAVLPPLSHPFNESGSKAGFGAGIKGTVRATTPVLDLKDGTGQASTTISFTGLKGGIKIPIKGWTWVPLPAPNTQVVVTNRLSASGNTGLITLTGVNSIKVVLNWPKVLKPVEAVIKTLLNGVLALFRGTISNAVQGKKFELFTLPTTIPGTNLGAKISFDTGGLRYFKSSVQALIRIRS
jgi:hypothetical protein